MTYLPVPELTDTLQRYLEIVRPLLTDAQFARTKTTVEEFATQDGPKAQEALERRAAEQNATGASWLTELWLATYLGGRTPLPLTSNVGFELTWTEPDSGLERAARLAHRLARVHLDHVRGEVEPLRSPRGEMLCMQQWSYLAGGIRRPSPGQDEIVPGSADAARREIVVLHRGRAFAVRVSDDRGAVVPRAELRNALEHVVAATPQSQEDPLPFAAWSYLGSDDAAGYEAQMLTDDHNAAVHDRLVQALFVLTLVDDAASPEEHLRATAFDYGVAWPFKPVTYVACLSDAYVGMHIEHTVADGGTLTAVLARAQSLTDDPDSGDDPVADRDRDAVDRTPETLRWRWPEGVLERLLPQVEAYVAAASGARVRPVRAPAITSDTLKLSADALQQFVILYAQLRTYGRVRSTYESVDMREYQAGRTEALRPVSTEAVALARALVDGGANPEMLHAALAEHKRRVVECKTGRGVDRHLLGLRIMAADLGLHPAMFADEGYLALTTDFLSTTSLGTDAQIARYAFAPTSEGGIGVGYCRRGDGAEYEFLLNHDATRAGDIDRFAEAIEDGVAALASLVASAD